MNNSSEKNKASEGKEEKRGVIEKQSSKTETIPITLDPASDLNSIFEEKKKRDWTLAHTFQVLSLFIAVTSLIFAIFSNKQSQNAQQQSKETREALESSRVEIGASSSNTDIPNYEKPWRKWNKPHTTVTTFVGVQRQVNFKAKFGHTPEIILAIKTENTRSLFDVINEISCKNVDESELDRLKQSHIVTEISDVTNDSFLLKVGVGMPSEAAKCLTNFLDEKSPSEKSWKLSDGFNRFPIGTTIANLTPEQKWMFNFYEKVGTIEVVWTAAYTLTN
jgi:hypothetical protein